VKVNIPTPLRSYTRQAAVVDAEGASVGQVLADIERRCPGFRFRIIDEQDGIREHIKIFVNEEQARNLDAPVRPDDTLHIICALSGGL
jgi:molybdopterin converting factor small subunit